jgi:biopolymer transport protein ExbB
MDISLAALDIPWGSLANSVSGMVVESGGLLAVVTPETTGNAPLTADVNYLEEFQKGGSVGITLAVLFLAMIGFTVERLLRLRSGVICPHGLVSKVLPMWGEGRFMDIVESCKKRPSLLAKMVLYFVEHRRADPELLIPGVNDIAVRGLRRHTQRTYSLAVVAALAPLLGLLGTMIGMIESFKLVEVYGDEGGASMLAGAISKALVTTAMGLIIAIPSLAIYHFFKFRIGALGNKLEEEIEILVNAWFLKQNPDAVAASQARVSTAEDREIDLDQEKPSTPKMAEA